MSTAPRDGKSNERPLKSTSELERVSRLPSIKRQRSMAGVGALPSAWGRCRRRVDGRHFVCFRSEVFVCPRRRGVSLASHPAWFFYFFFRFFSPSFERPVFSMRPTGKERAFVSESPASNIRKKKKKYRRTSGGEALLVTPPGVRKSRQRFCRQLRRRQGVIALAVWKRDQCGAVQTARGNASL